MDSGFLRCSKCSPVQHFHTKCYTLFLLVMLNFNLKRLFKVRFHIYHCSGSPHQTYSGAFAISIFETDHESVSDLYNTHYLKWQMTGLGDNPCGEMGCQIQCQMECGPFFFAARKKKNPLMLNMPCRKCMASTSVSTGTTAGYCKFWDQLHTTTWPCSCPQRVSWPAFEWMPSKEHPWQWNRLGNILPIGGNSPLTFRRAAFHPSHQRTPVSVRVRSINQGTKGRTSAVPAKPPGRTTKLRRISIPPEKMGNLPWATHFSLITLNLSGAPILLRAMMSPFLFSVQLFSQ